MGKHSATPCSLLVFVLPCLGSHLAQAQVLFQGFNWESWKKQGGWYNFLKGRVDDIAASEAMHVWLPPPSHSVVPQGYMSGRLYESKYSSQAELKSLIAAFHAKGMPRSDPASYASDPAAAAAAGLFTVIRVALLS